MYEYNETEASICHKYMHTKGKKEARFHTVQHNTFIHDTPTTTS